MIPKKYYSLVLFILGFGIFVFTRLSKLVPTIPIAILISFILILRFSRIKKNNWLTFLGFLLSINIGLWGLFELGGDISSLMFNIIRSSLLALLYFLPFMIDRYIYPKFKDKWYSTLVFPVITTAIFYILTIEGPFEGDIQPAKFAFGILIFKQFLSLFGSLGFVFLTSWLASVVNYMWENKFDWKKIRKITYILSSIIIIIILFGTIKVHMLPKADTVKVAAIIIDPDWGKETLMEKVFADRITSSFEETLAKIKDKTKIAASNNAKIVSFMEFAIIIDEEDHDNLREELKRIAQENNIYLTITYGYYVKDGKGKNIHLLIDNNGEILLDYQKRYLAGIGELAEKGVFVIGPEIIQSVDTPYGKIGLSVCRDMEMSKFIIQAAKADVDIMFSSAYEWPKTWLPNNLQTPIVNGFSLVRPAYNGVTHIQDYNGKILGEMYFEDTDTGILYADVPTKGVKTLYSYVGKLIGWLSALGLLVLTVLAIINRKREK
ncbi:MAG: carbon-nitrogen hydrolase family protein [Candidatus Peregrinibacteria bacterium]|nr:carbon-nitrogen hydrolase family protein [Candidatus Peregrinibacteria bacterium]